MTDSDVCRRALGCEWGGGNHTDGTAFKRAPDHGHRAASDRRKKCTAPSRAAQQAGRGAPARRRPRNGQHPLGRRSDGWLRGRPGRRHQPQGTRARAAVAHPVAQSRTPTCDGRWRCRRMSPRARRSPPRGEKHGRDTADTQTVCKRATWTNHGHRAAASGRRTSAAVWSIPIVGSVLHLKINYLRQKCKQEEGTRAPASLHCPPTLTTESPTTHYCTVQHHVPIDPYAERMPRADCSSNTIRDSISRVSPSLRGPRFAPALRHARRPCALTRGRPAVPRQPGTGRSRRTARRAALAPAVLR